MGHFSLHDNCVSSTPLCIARGRRKGPNMSQLEVNKNLDLAESGSRLFLMQIIWGTLWDPTTSHHPVTRKWKVKRHFGWYSMMLQWILVWNSMEHVTNSLANREWAIPTSSAKGVSYKFVQMQTWCLGWHRTKCSSSPSELVLISWHFLSTCLKFPHQKKKEEQ